MTAVIRFIAGWLIMGFVAALLTFGPALLRIVAFGPISLAYNFVA